MIDRSLAQQLIVLVARLPLCTAAELAILARAHPGSVRRELRQLTSARLLVIERHRVDLSRTARYLITPVGLRHVRAIPEVPPQLRADAFICDGLQLEALRNRIEYVSACRAVFLQLLEACHELAGDRVRLEHWCAPGILGSTCVDGFGVLGVGCVYRPVVLVLDRSSMALERFVPLAQAALGELSGSSGGVLVIGGPDSERVTWLCDRLRISGDDAAKIVPVNSRQAAREFVAVLMNDVQHVEPAHTVSPGFATTLGPLLKTSALVEHRLARLRNQLTPADIQVLDKIAIKWGRIAE